MRLFVLEDSNYKTGSFYNTYINEIGTYDKGHANENGIALAEFYAQNEHFLTNTMTMFMHRLLLQTTWTSPMRHFTTKDGTKRRNLIRNMIDYYITRKKIKHCVINARSYGNMDTDTDHKIVITEIKINSRSLCKGSRRKKKIRTDIGQLRNPKMRDKYAKETAETVVTDEEREMGDCSKYM